MLLWKVSMLSCCEMSRIVSFEQIWLGAILFLFSAHFLKVNIKKSAGDLFSVLKLQIFNCLLELTRSGNILIEIIPMLCAVWCHLYNLKNVKNTHGAVLLFVKFQASVCNFAKSNTAPWVFFTFLKLYKWYQIPQSITNAFWNNLWITLSWHVMEIIVKLSFYY